MRDAIACSLVISIHALRVEGDAVDMPEMIPAIGISIHALRVEGDDKYYK